MTDLTSRTSLTSQSNLEAGQVESAARTRSSSAGYRGLELSFRAIRLRLRIGIAWMRWRGKSPTLDMSTLVGFYRALWEDAARTLSATIAEIGPASWRIHRGSRQTLIHHYIVQIDDPVILRIAGDKALCHRILHNQDLPVPAHDVYTLKEFARAQRFMSDHPGSCFVVKPASGTSGARGVTTHIATLRECRRASALASLYGDWILIERWIPGESYRLLFLDDKMIHASRRRGHRVVGNGRSTIRALIAERADLARERMSTQAQREIMATLGVQGLDFESVPQVGRSVLIHGASKPLPGNVEIRTVFDEQATEDIGPDLREQAARAVRAIGSKFAGVDVITTNPAVALEEVGGVINEINTTPGLHHHYGLDRAHEGVPPAVRVLARLLGIAVTHSVLTTPQTPVAASALVAGDSVVGRKTTDAC